MTSFDAIVAGLGAAGSAALYHLARGGARVAGFDAHTPPHALGSSHGETRMIREAYYEGPRYVPLVRRAYDLWHELGRLAGATMIVETGGVFAGPPAGELITGLRESARAHGIPVEALSAAARSSRFPWLAPASDWVACTEPRAGFLYPERCITAHLRAADGHGAKIHTDEPVLKWTARAGGVEIETPRGRYRAEKLVLCTGPWMTEALATAGVQASVTRQPLFWFRSAGAAEAGPRTVWAIEFTPGKLLYGFPDVGTGFKLAIHYGGDVTTAGTIDREANDSEIREAETLLARYLPGIMSGCAKSAVCMYTNTPDLHFVIDAHPSHANVLLVSACSGHGFKFSSAIGEAAAQWTLDGAPKLDLSAFAIARFKL
jgi:sarcosine oxidase